MSDTKAPGKTVWVVMGGSGGYGDNSRWTLCACACEESAERIAKEANAESAALRRATSMLSPNGLEYTKRCEARVVDRTESGKMEYGDYWVHEVEVRS